MRPLLDEFAWSKQPPFTDEERAALPVGLLVVQSIYINAGKYDAVTWRVAEGGLFQRHLDGERFGEPEALDRWAVLSLPRLPRLSCAMTLDAVLRREKDVTRRLHLPKWAERGRLALLVDKIRAPRARGLAVVELVSTRLEEVRAIDERDVRREGFPHLTPEAFVDLFCEAQGCGPGTRVWRIEWRYI